MITCIHECCVSSTLKSSTLVNMLAPRQCTQGGRALQRCHRVEQRQARLASSARPSQQQATASTPKSETCGNTPECSTHRRGLLQGETGLAKAAVALIILCIVALAKDVMRALQVCWALLPSPACPRQHLMQQQGLQRKKMPLQQAL